MGVQDEREKFSGGIKMAQIGARIPAADGAAAIFINRARIFGVLRVANQHAALRSEEAAVARAARGQHAIHHVHAQAT